MDNKILDNSVKQRSENLGLGIIVIFLLLLTSVVLGLLGMEKAAIAALSFPALYGLASLLWSHKKENKTIGQ
jgi:hypothetical protein